MSKARIYARNLAANWIGHGASVVVLFFLSPFVVHTLGKTEYGIWSLMTVVTGYLGLFDIGVRSSTGRYIIFYLGREDHKSVGETIRTGLGFFSVIGLLMLASGLVVGWLFPEFFPSVPERYHGMVVLLLPILAVGMWLSALAAVFSSVLRGHDRFDLTRGVDLVVLGVRAAGTIIALKLGYGLIGLALLSVVCRSIALGGNWCLARRIYPRLKAWPLLVRRSRLKELLGYGIAAFVSRASVKLIGQTSLIVVGVIISVASVTTYSVGAMLVLYSWPFLDMISQTLFPALQRASARGDEASERWYYLRQIRMAVLFGVPTYLGLIFFGRAFIHLWMAGPEFDETCVSQAAAVMAILSVARLCALHSFAPSSLLWARGRVWFDAIATAIEATASLGLGVLLVLVFDLDMYGVALGGLIAMVTMRGIVIPWRGTWLLGLSWKRFLGLGAAALVSAALFSGWCLLIQRVVPADSWGVFAADVAAALVGYAAVAVVLLVPRRDRQRVVSVVRAWLTRKEAPSEV